MKKIYIMFGFALSLLVLSSSCQKSNKDAKNPINKENTSTSQEKPKEEIKYVEIKNAALLEALKKQGFTIKDSKIALDDKSMNLTYLNLSSSDIDSLSGIENFPKLKSINLSNNNLGKSFDFNSLPKNIKSVNLSANKIYFFKGLINSQGTGTQNQTVRQFDSLVLPYSARFNMETLPQYFKLNASKTMLIRTKDNKVEAYSTLRDASSPACLNILKKYYSSILTGDKIDITKLLSDSDASNSIYIYKDKDNDYSSLAYVINNPAFKAKSIEIVVDKDVHIDHDMGYIRIPASVERLETNAYSYLVDLSSATNLYSIKMTSNLKVEKIDLSASKTFLKEAKTYRDKRQQNTLYFVNCPQLKSIQMPKQDNAFALATLFLCSLENFDSINTGILTGVRDMVLVDLPSLKNLDLSNIENVLDNGGNLNSSRAKISFIIDTKIAKFSGVKTFMERMKSKLDPNGYSAKSSINKVQSLLGKTFDIYQY